jgi:hypothetical protein
MDGTWVVKTHFPSSWSALAVSAPMARTLSGRPASPSGESMTM